MTKIKSKKNIISPCSVCKSTNTEELYKQDIDVKKISFTYSFNPAIKKTFRVVRCNNCSHVFCHPLPKNIYKNYKDVVDETYLTQEYDRKVTAKVLLKEISKYKKSGKILDVGCATGDFLEVAREQGYIAEGVELSKWSSAIARKKGLTVYRSTLQSIARRFPERYDVITMWGVIEHFEDPLQELHNLNKLLKPGGIVVAWTGDIDSITSKLLGRNWWYWMGQHIQYFSRKSIKLLGERTGFREVFSKTYPQALTYVRIENSLNRYTNIRFIYLLFQIIFKLKPVWILKLPGELFWMARKSRHKSK